MNKFNRDYFNKSSNSSIYNNSLFNFKNNKKEKIVVEGPDDIDFYKGFLVNIYDDLYLPDITCVVDGKKEVMKLAKMNKVKRNKYIVDLDYDQQEKINSNGAIATTGYSMENFYLYIDENYNNLLKLIKVICDDYGIIHKAEDFIEYELMKKLNEFLDEKIYYFAYMKTLHEFNRPFSKDVKDAEVDYLEVINNEINSYSEYEKKKIKKSYDLNINFIRDNKYLYLRGHDVFEVIFDYFCQCKYIDNSKITKKYIYSLSEYLYVPNSFKLQFENGE